MFYCKTTEGGKFKYENIKLESLKFIYTKNVVQK